MEPKPFSIKSPEEVASAYGGNKQKIAQAIQMGALDPTSGLLAGMFIDRMRSAQAMEQAPQQTVAQQVLAPSTPPAPPAGLGAIGPQGGAMPPAPPPPPAGLGAMPPVGMAAGGMTELPTSYGLDSLPIPDNMYDEQSFAGGGIVAFAKAGSTEDRLAEAERVKYLRNKAYGASSKPEERAAAIKELALLSAPSGPTLAGSLAVPTSSAFQPEEPIRPFAGINALTNLLSPAASLAGESSTPPSTAPSPLPGGRPYVMGSENAVTPAPVRTPAPRGERGVADVAGGAPRATRMNTASTAPVESTPSVEAISKEMKKLIGSVPEVETVSAEEKASQKNEDLYSILAQIGFGMAAGESPNFLTNVGKATAAATPAIQEAIKERRKDTKEERKERMAQKMAQLGLDKDTIIASYAEMGRLDNKQLKEREMVLDAELRREQIKASKDIAGMQLNQIPADIRTFREYERFTPEQKKEYLKLNPPYNPTAGLSGNVAALKAAQEGLKSQDRAIMTDPNKTPEQKRADRALIAQKLAVINEALAAGTVGLSGLGGGLTSPDYSGFKVTAR